MCMTLKGLLLQLILIKVKYQIHLCEFYRIYCKIVDML